MAIQLITGCTARIPEPTAYPYSQQMKIQAVHHWQILAKDVADRVNNVLILNSHRDLIPRSS